MKWVCGLVAARAVGELYVTLVPAPWAAPAPALADGPASPDQIPDPKLAALKPWDDELYLRYDFTWA